MLELQNITATDRGITDLSFSPNPGEIVAIIGLNGAEKTTFFRLALGILRPR